MPYRKKGGTMRRDSRPVSQRTRLPTTAGYLILQAGSGSGIASLLCRYGAIRVSCGRNLSGTDEAEVLDGAMRPQSAALQILSAAVRRNRWQSPIATPRWDSLTCFKKRSQFPPLRRGKFLDGPAVRCGERKGIELAELVPCLICSRLRRRGSFVDVKQDAMMRERILG